ncbi:UreF-domain-containing protein [Rostrohypoxylon terebratum]|nr:UreF-domain-containing protein [Rostrohypoxylon terebratum]
MMNLNINDDSPEVLENEIADLELRLRRAKERLAKSKPVNSQLTILSSPSTQSAHHYLLLLSDSALPLGSFAFSSGLESYLAHTRRTRSSSSAATSSFSSFLPLSLSSYASTTLPFVLAAHRDPDPANVATLDDTLDAAIICTVGRRASVAQGRALLSIWEKSIAGIADPGARLKPFSDLLRASAVSAHLAPLFGAVAALCGLSLRQTAYVFMLGHVKALVSAAVRAGLFGPYHAQRILASAQVQDDLLAVIEREWCTPVERAGQCVPVMELWVGRHELLYSRIFNS